MIRQVGTEGKYEAGNQVSPTNSVLVALVEVVHILSWGSEGVGHNWQR